MKSNALEDVLQALKSPRPEQVITIDEPVRLKALKSLEAMFKYTQGASAAVKKTCE
jgi:quinolinate synthase